MTPTRSSTRATSGRRRLLAEVERLASELREPGRIEDTLATLIGGEGTEYGIAPDELFSGGVPRIRPVLVHLAAQGTEEISFAQFAGCHFPQPSFRVKFSSPPARRMAA